MFLSHKKSPNFGRFFPLDEDDFKEEEEGDPSCQGKGAGSPSVTRTREDSCAMRHVIRMSNVKILCTGIVAENNG